MGTRKTSGCGIVNFSERSSIDGTRWILFWGHGLDVSIWLFLTCINTVAFTFVVFLSRFYIANGMESRVQE